MEDYTKICEHCGKEFRIHVTTMNVPGGKDKEEVDCPYCHKSDPRPLNAETVKYSGLEVSMVGRATVLRVRNFSDDECVNFDHQDAIIINYCPMCGRHLHSTV